MIRPNHLLPTIGSSLLLAALQLTLVASLLQPEATNAQAGLVIFSSREIGGQSQVQREAVDLLDDEWRAAASAAGFAGFQVGSVSEAELPVVLRAPNGFEAEVSLRDFSSQNLRQPRSSGTVAGTQGRAASGTTASMQDGAPKPESLYRRQEPYYNESAGSASDRNALLFSFGQPVAAFGAWFGDLETRTEGGGTAAIVRLFDEDGQRIGLDYPVVPSTPDQRLCGAPANDDFRGCGNGTTVWIGFVADPARPVTAMLVVVGDDDTVDGSDDGTREHISFIGATVSLESPPTPTTSPSATPSPTPTATATASATSSPVPKETRTATPTATPTPEPRPVYLPVLLHLVCPPARVDVTLVLDLSTSMRQSQPSGRTRLDEALLAASTFLSLLELEPDSNGRSDQAAIVWFNQGSTIEQPLTRDLGALTAALERLPNRVAQGTRLDLALERGLAAALGPARDPSSIPVLLLLTDGLPNGTTSAEVLARAGEVKRSGVVIHAVGTGQRSEIDEGLLRQIASSPGHYRYAPDAAALRALYVQLASQIRCPAGRGLPEWP